VFDVRDVLERTRERLVPPSGAFERLVVFRTRRRRRQRVATGLLALTVAIGATILLVRAFHAGDVPLSEPTTSPTPSLALDPREVATFPVGNTGETNAILSADGSIWVTGYGVNGGGGVDRAALFRIDPATDDVTDVFPMDTAPTREVGGGGVAFADGSIWVTGGGKPTGDEPQAILDRVDPSTGKIVATIPLGGRFGADLAINEQGVWVGIFTDGDAEIVRVDPTTNQVAGRTELPSSYVSHVEAIDGAVVAQELEWSGGEGPCGYLTRVDPATGEVAAREAVGDPCGLTRLLTWNGRIWSTIGERFAPLDPATLKPAVQGFAFEAEHFPRGFLVPDDTGIWYAAYPGGDGNRPDRLTRMDPATGEVSSYPLTLDHGPIAATILDGSLFALNFDGSVTRIDLLADGG
jgi:streptogramin lyase